MLTRTLLLGLVIGVLWYLYRRSRSIKKASSRFAPPHKMSACGYCGVHIPDNECVHDDGAMFCCEEHRRLSQKAPRG